MRFWRENRRRVAGFTLVEAAVFLFVFSVISLTFYETWTLGMRHIANAKYRLGATAVANQQMEIIRSLVFDDIGTTSGIPTGTLPVNQTITANTTTYHVLTAVSFVDDSTDGKSGSGDLAPNDYKRVTLTVSWGGGTTSEQVMMSSLFSLDGVESVAAGTGVLSVNILDHTGAGVSGASVRIVNASVVPPVDFTDTTDATGNLSYPGTPASVQGYTVSVSKSGYYANTTYPSYPTSSFDPVSLHASVVAGSLTAMSLTTDQRSTIAFRTTDPFGNSVPNIDFSLTGGLAIGTHHTTGAIVYDFSQAVSTNGSGEYDFSDRSVGLYTATLDGSETGYQYLHLLPEEATFGTTSVPAGTTQTVTMVLADKNLSSALVTVTDSGTSTAIAGASVRLYNTTLGYDTTLTTDTYGQAYFPTSATPLVSGTYDIEVSASGYTNQTSTLSIPGGSLRTKSIGLSP